jgi:hypothetical protein
MENGLHSQKGFRGDISGPTLLIGQGKYLISFHYPRRTYFVTRSRVRGTFHLVARCKRAKLGWLSAPIRTL